MKIVHLIWQFKCGGAETMLVDIVNEQSLVADVSLIIGNDILDQSVIDRLNSRVKVKFIGRPPGSRNPWYILKLLLIIRNIQADIIHTHLESFIQIIRHLKIPKVLTVHNTGIKLSRAAYQYDTIFSISDAVQIDLLNRHSNLKTTVVNNGIDFSKIKEKYFYKQKPFKIVQVSRLDHKQKGQDILLHALKYINSTLGNGKVTIDFIGDGISKNYLVELAEELNVQEWCRFLGQRTRKYVYENLCNYDLLVQPSRFEGFGLTIVEAIAALVPVLVSNIEGPMEIIDKGKNGYFFRAEDSEDCGKLIVSIVSNLKESKFINCRKEISARVKRKYDVTVTAGKYIDEYTKVICRTNWK